MGRFSKFFFAVCIAATAAESPSFAAEPAGGKIRMLHFDDAKKQPSFHAARTGDRLRRIAEWCIPSPHAVPRKVTWSVEKDPYLFRFHAKSAGLRKETNITVPAYFPGWIRDPVVFRKLTAWVVLARLGRGPEMAEAITGHWIIRGLAYKALADSREQAKFQFTKDYPVAWALASHGIYPALDSVFTTDHEEIYSASSEWTWEYAALLLEACHRSGFLRESLAENLLNAALSGTDGGDARTAFFKAADALGTVRKQKKRKDERNVIFNEWFQENVKRSLLSFFMPESPECSETRYWAASECYWTDADGKTRSCRPAELPLLRAEIPDAAGVVAGLLSRLTVRNESHPMIQEQLSDLRSAIAQYALEGTPEQSAEKIRAAEKELIRIIDFLVQTEHHLSFAQIRFVQPGARMAHLLRAVRRQPREHTAFSGVDERLDKWDDYR